MITRILAEIKKWASLICWTGSLLLIGVSTPVWAAPDIFVVLSGNSRSADEVATNLQSELGGKLLVRQFDSAWQSEVSPDDLIISVGNKASRAIIQKDVDNPVVHSFVSSGLIASIPDSTQNWVAITLDQPISRLFNKAQALTKVSYKADVLIAVSESNQAVVKQVEELQSKGVANSIKLVNVSEGDVAAKVLQPYFYNAAALIAIRDKNVWSGNNAKWILKQAYNHQVPVIGYSQSFLKAGALVAIYSTLEQVSEEVIKAAKMWQESGQLPNKSIVQPDYQTGVNKNIARALKLTPSVIEELESKR